MRCVSRRLIASWILAVLTAWILAAVVDRFVPPARTSGMPRSPVAVLSTWDGLHYASIASNGYSTSGSDVRLFAFFPLLPVTARLLGGVTYATLAGVLVSQICLLGCMILLNRIAGVSPEALLRFQPGFWLLISPLSFFFFVFYTESLYLFLTLLMIAAYRTERFIAAGLFGLMAGMTRPTAFHIPVIFIRRVLGNWWQQRSYLGVLLCAATPLLGISLYMLFVDYSVGQSFAYLEIQSGWWRAGWGVPFVSLGRDLLEFIFGLSRGRLIPIAGIVRLFSSVSILLLLAWGWRRLDPPFRAYMIISMIFIHSQEPSRSTARYELVLFPLFFLIPVFFARYRRLTSVAIAMMVFAEVVLFLRHVSGRWVA
jgi:hypothetical protein